MHGAHVASSAASLARSSTTWQPLLVADAVGMAGTSSARVVAVPGSSKMSAMPQVRRAAATAGGTSCGLCAHAASTAACMSPSLGSMALGPTHPAPDAPPTGKAAKQDRRHGGASADATSACCRRGVMCASTEAAPRTGSKPRMVTGALPGGVAAQAPKGVMAPVTGCSVHALSLPAASPATRRCVRPSAPPWGRTVSAVIVGTASAPPLEAPGAPASTLSVLKLPLSATETPEAETATS